jgi:hypothetical protein
LVFEGGKIDKHFSGETVAFESDVKKKDPIFVARVTKLIEKYRLIVLLGRINDYCSIFAILFEIAFMKLQQILYFMGD